MRGCAGVTKLCVPKLEGVTAIPAGFLEGCTGLTRVGLAGLESATSLGVNFMKGCSKLEEIDFGALSNVRVLSEGFLEDCTSLTEVDLSQFTLTSLPDNFMRGCAGVTKLCVPKLEGVTDIPAGFLVGCKGMSNFDFAGLNIQGLPKDFLQGWDNLESVTYSKITAASKTAAAASSGSCCNAGITVSLQPYFLRDCKKLRLVDLSGFTLSSIPDAFLSGCSAVKELNLSVAGDVRFGMNFMKKCTTLEIVKIGWVENEAPVEPPANLLTPNFLETATELKTVELTGFCGTFPDNFLPGLSREAGPADFQFKFNHAGDKKTAPKTAPKTASKTTTNQK
jgi:hypothetical protein